MDAKRKLYEAVEACAEKLDQLNSKFPNLATDSTKESVVQWKRNKDRIVLDQAPAEAPDTDGQGLDVRLLAIELMGENELEDVLDILSEVHKIEMTMAEFVDAIGNELYIDALRRDARSLTANSISYNQIANLWNDLERPCLGGERWEASGVSILAE
jgi:hypothetical protein